MTAIKNDDFRQPSQPVEQACVVIVTYNHSEYIQDCLESVMENNPGEVVVVDSGSTDGTIESVKASFPEVRLIECENNIGYGSGNNQGIEQVDSEFIVVLNPDTILSDNCLDQLLEPLAADEALITVPKILTYDGEMVNTVGITTHFSGLAFVRGYQKDPSEFNEKEELTGFSGACFATTRETYDRMGGFESSIFIYMDDVELSWKANAIGVDVHYVPSAIVYHDYPGINLSADKLFHLERGRYLILRKYLSVQSAALLFPSLLLTELLTWGYAIGQGWKGMSSKARALIDAFSTDVDSVDVDSRELVTRMDSEIPYEHLPVSPLVHHIIRSFNKIYKFNSNIVKQ